MSKEININLTTIIDLFSDILENKKIYLSTKDLDLEYLNHKYIFINNLLNKINKDNNFIIYCNYDDKIYKKRLKKIIIILRNIVHTYNKIKVLIESTISKDSSNMSLVDMSNILFNLTLEDDELNKFYEKIKNSNYEIIEYCWISNFIYDMKDSSLISDYLKYNKFNQYNKFKYLNEDISYDEISNIEYKLNCLLNNKYALTPPIYINNFTSYFIDSKFSLNISESELLSQISNLNVDDNYSKFKKIKWYHYLNRKKYNKLKSYNNDILEKRENIKKSMFNQYKENLEALNLYVKSFEFLKYVIKDSYFNKIYDYLYDENDMFSFLKSISETLSIYKEFLSIKNHINKLTNRELELLDFCYNKNDTIDNYKKRVFIFPNILILYHFKNSIATLSQHDINRENMDTLIMQLNNDLDILSKLLYNDNYDLLSYLKIDEDISNTGYNKYEDHYVLKQVEYDECLMYIDDYLKSNIYKSEIYSSNHQIVKFIKSTITNLGYKIVENFKLDGIILDLIVFNSKNPKSIIYIFIDTMVINSYDTIRKLSYIKGKNIPIIYCWSDEFFINKNLEILKLNIKLENLLS